MDLITIQCVVNLVHSNLVFDLFSSVRSAKMQQGPHTFVGYMFCQKTGGRSQQQTTSTARTKVNLMTRMMELESLGNPICQFLCFKNKKGTFDKICKNLGSASHVCFEDMLEAESIRQTFVDLLTFGVKLVGLYGCNIP